MFWLQLSDQVEAAHEQRSPEERSLPRLEPEKRRRQRKRLEPERQRRDPRLRLRALPMSGLQ